MRTVPTLGQIYCTSCVVKHAASEEYLITEKCLVQLNLRTNFCDVEISEIFWKNFCDCLAVFDALFFRFMKTYTISILFLYNGEVCEKAVWSIRRLFISETGDIVMICQIFHRH